LNNFCLPPAGTALSFSIFLTSVPNLNSEICRIIAHHKIYTHKKHWRTPSLHEDL
jgi:hypothetical protein